MHYFRQRNDSGDIESQGRSRFPVALTWRDEMDENFKDSCPSMSYENRMYSFLGCIIIGALLSAISILWASMGQVLPFAILYSIGSVLGLASTMFLVGPLRQFKLMFHKNRWIATLLYLLLIGLTLFVAFFDKLNKRQKVPLILILVILQFLAACWYSLSYIPYARKVLSKACGGACDCMLK